MVNKKRNIRSKVNKTKRIMRRSRRSLKRRPLKKNKRTKRTKRTKRKKRTKRNKRTKRTKRTKRNKRMKGGMETTRLFVDSPPEGYCHEGPNQFTWPERYIKIAGKALTVYELDKNRNLMGGPIESSILDLTGVTVSEGVEPFGMRRKPYLKLIISGRNIEGDVELAFSPSFQRISEKDMRGEDIKEEIKLAIENISQGREWNVSLDRQYLESKQKELQALVDSKISEIEGSEDIFVRTFNKLKRISGASFIRLLRINGINIVLIGDPHGMGEFGKDGHGNPRWRRNPREERNTINYEYDRLCSDVGLGALRIEPGVMELKIFKHADYAAFEAHEIDFRGNRRKYGITEDMEYCTMMDLVKFCIDNSSSVDAFPEAASFGVLTRLNTSSSKYQTMLCQELDWLSIWNGLTDDQQGSARDKLKVHATDQRAGSYKGLDSLLVILLGRNSASKGDLKVLEPEEYTGLLDKFPEWKTNIQISGGRKHDEMYRDRFTILYKLHQGIINSEDPWKTIRDIYLCLATFGIHPGALEKSIQPHDYLSDHIELVSLEGLFFLLSQYGITAEKIQSMKERIIDEGDLLTVRGEIIKLIEDTKGLLLGEIISEEYMELYRFHYEKAKVGYEKPKEYLETGLKINEFLVDYFASRGFISDDDKPHVVAILHFAGLDFCLGTFANTTTQVNGLMRPTLVSDAELVEFQRPRRLTTDQVKYYSQANPVGVDTYTTTDPFPIPGNVRVARTTKLAKQLLQVGKYEHGIKMEASLNYIFSYLSLIGTAEYPNHYWGSDFLYDVYTSLRLDRLLLKHIPLIEIMKRKGITIDPKTASILFDMLEKDIPKAELGRIQVTSKDYLSRLPEETLTTKITEASSSPPKTILVIGGASQTNIKRPGSFLVSDPEEQHYAAGHSVETLKFFDRVFEKLDPGRGGGVIGERESDCSVLEGLFPP